MPGPSEDTTEDPAEAAASAAIGLGHFGRRMLAWFRPDQF